MQSMIRTGAVLAGFRVESLIGQGAMGAVYLAVDTKAGGRVALKLLTPELSADERFRQRFMREAELAASLEHPHVVPILSFGEEDGRLYLAMAHVEGTDLRQLLRREVTLEPTRALDLVAQVADALDAAHAAELVHRDVKPANILVAPVAAGEHAYVCDFGLARHMSSVSSLTGDRGFVGTLDYVPPEQIAGGPIDRRADVYSLGCVLYECLTGERPFERDSELALVYAHLNDPPPRATDLRLELPQALDGVIATALAKEPEDRYASCGELAAAGRAALAGKPFRRSSRRRRRLLVATIAVLAAAAAGITGFLAVRGEGSKPSATTTGPPSITQTSIARCRARRVEGVLWQALRRLQAAHADGDGAVDSGPLVRAARGGGLLSSEPRSGGHHHDLEPAQPHRCGDRALFDAGRAEEGLREERAPHAAPPGGDARARVRRRAEPDLRDAESANDLRGRPLPGLPPEHDAQRGAELGALRHRGRDALYLARALDRPGEAGAGACGCEPARTRAAVH